MHLSFTLLVLLSAFTTSVVAWAPLSSLQGRANNTFVNCLEQAGLDPVLQDEASYAANSSAYNLRFNYKPAAIVYPNNSTQVAAAVKCGAASGVKVNARGGGHSYAAFALGGEDGHLTVSLDRLRHLSLNGSTVTIGGGNRLGDVALYLWNNGKRALAHGTCPYVGIGGHAGQGGFGIPSRAWGLLADQITSIEIVTAAGDILTASSGSLSTGPNESSNPDLFWAAMGAGASFGIITQFTAETHEAVDSIAFQYAYANYTAEEASSGLLAWQKFASDPDTPLDANVGMQLHVSPDASTPHGIAFSVSGSYYGADVSKLNATMAPLLSALGNPTTTTIQTQDWITSVLYYAGAQNGSSALNTTTAAPDIHDHFYATSTFVSEQEPLGKASADALMQYFYGPGTKSAVEWFVIFDLYGGSKSAIRGRDADFNAFDARDALYSIQYYGTIPSSVSDQDGIKFIQGIKAALEQNQSNTTFKEYVNYIDSTYSAEVAHQKYYPTHTSRLTDLKNKYDANRVFHYPYDF
ncbi:FAD-binding domain-containing protein [Lentinus tigrinus ALCF2SS1-7]|uniref:FAD-binding domain-containing protein n=1 Tax=Lentinus tigrinus ALCF2SS1-6 TaxID=1328759 RepID=A0A5C2RQN0_9APHY|nr:FAD-binding domain-containing protein [Lentinus tigrinus ALCF2SS1-6]RPD72656.1 FAD-binding domain-containing protein [Lentinus tigrinus ALCF2SS1-7]